MIRAVLFDFGQTLVDSSRGFRTAEKDAQQALFSKLCDVSWDDFIGHYRETRRAFHERSEFSRAALWRAVLEHFGGRSGSLVQWETSYWDTVNRHTRAFPETVPVLEVLSGRLRLGLISNTQGQQHVAHRLAQFPDVQGWLEATVVAGEKGMPPKPDPRPFITCLDQLEVEASEAVFVGDDYRIDICGAAAVGMRPIWLQHHSVPRQWPAVATTVPRITSLDPLRHLPHRFPTGLAGLP